MSRRVVPLRPSPKVAAELSDEALIAACAVGENAALGTLFDRNCDAVRRFLARLSGTDDRDLDDLVQATFEAVPRAARRFDGRSTGRSWLLGVANNISRHHVRSEVRRKRLAQAVAADPRPQAVDATAAVLERERADRLGAAIVNLAPKLREVFVLVYLEGVPGRDAAGLLGIREGTVWKRLHQARTRLRDSLQGVDR